MTNSDSHFVRLNKYISQTGYCSRRKADELIEQGKVLVNNVPVKELGTKIDPDVDEVRIKQGPILKPSKKKVLLMLNKPKGYVCTKSDPFESKTVYELLPPQYQSLVTIGRLDKDTEGLLLFTNDGELANQLAHPKFGKEKTYLVTARGQLDEKDLKRISKTMYLRDYVVKGAKVKEMSFDKEKDRAIYEVTISEGKNRQIHNMFLVLKHPVKRLMRTSFGEYKLGTLKTGEFKLLKI
ncbi:MAG: pseudouridine synthase [Candidatus Altimarinota bacterium]